MGLRGNAETNPARGYGPNKQQVLTDCPLTLPQCCDILALLPELAACIGGIMPVYKIETFKQIGSETWANRWWVFAANLTAAAGYVPTLVDAERGYLSTSAGVVYARVSTPSEIDKTFVTVPVNLAGQNAQVTSGNIWPLFNCVRVNFSKPLGRPDYKLFRGYLSDSNTDGPNPDSNLKTDMTASFVDLIEPDGLGRFICSEDGEEYSDVVVDPNTRQRDLHRRKRRVVPQV